MHAPTDRASMPFFSPLKTRFVQVGSICLGRVYLTGADCPRHPQHALPTTATAGSYAYGVLSANSLHYGTYANQGYRHAQQQQQDHKESDEFQQHVQLLQQQEQYTLLQQRLLLQKLRRELEKGDGDGGDKAHENIDLHSSRSQSNNGRSQEAHVQDQRQAVVGGSRHAQEMHVERLQHDLASGGDFVLICTCFNTAAMHEKRSKAGLVHGGDDEGGAAQVAGVGLSLSPDDQGFLRIVHIKQGSSAAKAAMMGEMVCKSAQVL